MNASSYVVIGTIWRAGPSWTGGWTRTWSKTIKYLSSIKNIVVGFVPLSERKTLLLLEGTSHYFLILLVSGLSRPFWDKRRSRRSRTNGRWSYKLDPLGLEIIVMQKMVVVTSTVNAVRQSSNVFVISFQGGTGTPGGTGLEGPLGPSVSYWL